MRIVYAAILLSWTLTAGAACRTDRPQEQPPLPDGEIASRAEMNRAQLAMDKYRLQVERYLDCSALNRRQHNTLLSQLEMLLEQYDEELLEYQVRENMVAEK